MLPQAQLYHIARWNCWNVGKLALFAVGLALLLGGLLIALLCGFPDAEARFRDAGLV
jgi:hypothetical protein